MQQPDFLDFSNSASLGNSSVKIKLRGKMPYLSISKSLLPGTLEEGCTSIILFVLNVTRKRR